MDRLLAMQIFERVANEGGFAAAARALNISPPVVTRVIAELETHLGTRLFQRTTRCCPAESSFRSGPECFWTTRWNARAHRMTKR